MSDASSCKLAVGEETVAWGTEATATQYFRYTGDSLGQDTDSAESEEIRADRRVAGVIRTGFNAGGDINYEFSALTLDALMEGALMSDWATLVLTDGSTAHSYTIEKDFSDVTANARYLGMMVTSWSLNIAPGSIINGSFSFLGKSEDSTAVTASPSAAETTEICNAIDHVTVINENDTPILCTALSFTVNNNLRSRLQISSLGPISIGLGVFSVSGTLQKYFASSTLMNKYLNWTETSLDFTISDATADSYSYKFEFPNVRFTSGRRVAGGQNTDIIADMGWTAYYDSVEECLMRITKTLLT